MAPSSQCLCSLCGALVPTTCKGGSLNAGLVASTRVAVGPYVAVPGRAWLTWQSAPSISSSSPGQLSSGSSLVQFWCSSGAVWRRGDAASEVHRPQCPPTTHRHRRQSPSDAISYRGPVPSPWQAVQLCLCEKGSVCRLVPSANRKVPANSDHDGVDLTHHAPLPRAPIRAPTAKAFRSTPSFSRYPQVTQGYLTTGKNGTHPTAARPVGEILSSVPELDSTERSPRS
ncbi:hypothetical protein B0H65DRAFT_439769 [Neurospora tetraspora]|uniref:Uncharacterized protein n=1 Tax=Neurospora tetraspora TaxID=94610 RepID=A0AAE0MTQ4_9PEZI|nr:hypothetical protein B0H65DRAFT_439769 [Neurospora tetraspora]